MVLQILGILGIVILSPIALLMVVIDISLLVVGIQMILDPDELDRPAESWDSAIEELRELLADYYFDNPLPEDGTDDVGLLDMYVDDRLRPMTDEEVLEEVAKLIRNGEIKS